MNGEEEREHCQYCNRRGDLVSQFVCPANGIITEAFVFRYYLCRYHRATENRKVKKYGWKRFIVIDFVPDEELLKEVSP
jgi:hypothetical protein